MKAALIALLAALILPSAAIAQPTAILTGPTTGQCVGSTAQPVTGSATGEQGPAFSWQLTVSRDDNGAVFQTQQGSQTAPMPGSNALTYIDTTILPSGTLLRLTLNVHDANGDDTASIAFQPQFDRTNPGKPTVETLLAVSSRQVWAQFSNVRDQGCSGGVRGYETFTNSAGLSGENNTDNPNIVNGSSHVALSAPVLTGGTSYLVQAESIDKVGLRSGSGIGYSITTPSNYETVLAGQVTGQGNPLFGIRVTATRGTVSKTTVTGASGLYNLSVPWAGGNETWNMRYETSGLPFAATGWATATDTVTTSSEIGRIVPHNKAMQP